MFDINWTKKTKIVVNGKEYERLEDVPEPFRSMLKNKGILQKAEKTWSFTPFLKINLPAGEPLTLDPSVPLALPAGFRIDDDGGKRSLSWSWFTWQALGGLVFVVIWNVILALWLHSVFLTKAPGWVWLVAALMTAAGAGMTYAIVAMLVNRTSLRVDAAQLSLRHGPLPWLGGRDVCLADIDSVCCEKYEGSDETLWDPAVSYAVKLMIKGSGPLRLVSGLRAPEQALYIEREIRTRS